MMKKTRFGLIGCGDIAHVRYFYSFPLLKNAELVGLYDINEPFLKATAEKLGVKAYDSYEQMLDDLSIDAIIVTTYHPSHVQLSIQALKAGKHVISEKPVATSVEDALLLKKEAQKSNRIFMALPNDASPEIVKVKELIDKNVIGNVCSIDGLFAHQGPLHAPWFFDYQKAQWGVLADLGIYPISTLTYLFGPVDRVSGETRCLQKRRISLQNEVIVPSVEDNAVATLAWADGKLATIRSNWCTAADKNFCFWEMNIYGSDGIIYLNVMNKEETVVVISPDKPVEGGKQIKFKGLDCCYNIDVGDADVKADVMKIFLKAVEKNEKMPDDGCSIVRQTHVIEIIDKIYQSSNLGKMMKIDSVF